MKYFRSKLLIVLCSAAATIGVWAALAWPAWHAASPGSAASAVVLPVATAAPPPTPEPAPITPAPTAPPPQEPAVVRRVVYVPRSGADLTADPGAPAGAAPPPDAVPSVPDAAPVDQAPPPQDTAPQPVATRQPPVQAAAPTPAPTPIESGAS